MSDSAYDLVSKVRAGRYMGEGVNHEGQPFNGALELRSLLGQRAFGLSFSARGAGGEDYHQEETILGPGPQGELCLVSVNTNDPLLRTYALVRDETHEETRRLVFGWGRPEERETFRCQISLEVYPNGDLGYRYAWGLPGGGFADRSGVRMRVSQER